MKNRSNSSTGWECPKCHRIWGPFIEGCPVCNDNFGTPATTPEKPFGPKIHDIFDPNAMWWIDLGKNN
jgi:hypothetical protein